MARSYFLKSEVGPIGRMWRKAVHRIEPVPEFPHHVQIQTKSGCNADCIFCPNTETLRVVEHGTMSWDLWVKIADELIAEGCRRIRPYLMNEPLSDRDLAKRIRYMADRKGPKTIIKINTNASFLKNDETCDRVIESGLDRMNVSFHGISKETYEKSMGGLTYEESLANIERIQERKRVLGIDTPQIKITMVNSGIVKDELARIPEFWKARGCGVNIRPLTDRANSRVHDLGVNPQNWEPFSWCKRLMEQMYILWNGDAVMCCNDWHRTTVMGNVRDKSLREVWNSDYYNKLRGKFFKGDVGDMLCGTCHMIRI